MYLPISLAMESDAQIHHPTRDTLAEAMAEADKMPERDAQVLEVSGPRRVVATREAGRPWDKI